MDFALLDHQEQLVAAARRWATEQLDADAVGDADGRGRLWHQLIETGWLDLLGAGTGQGSLLDAALLVEQLAEHRCPLPVSSALIASRLSADLHAEGTAPGALVAGAISGSRPLIGRQLDLDRGLLLVRPAAVGGSDWHLAVTSPGEVSVAVVQDEHTIALHQPRPEAVDDLHWQAVDAGTAASRWLSGAVLSAAELVGLAQATVTDASRYAKDRVQGGKPIGGHQAIQHRLADMLGYVERCRYLTYAAAASDEHTTGIDAQLAHQAKALAARDCLTVLRSGHQVMGAIAFSAEHQLPSAHKQALIAAVEFGSASEHWVALDPS